MAKLHFYYSAMNAGKSTMLLQSSYNYQERGMGTLVFAPKITGKSVDQNIEITSRIGLSGKAFAFDESTDLFREAAERIEAHPNIQCLLIDEAQFLTKAQARQLCHIVDDLNRPVLAYGIRTDFQGEPFEGSMYLLAWADLIIEIKTICHCGKKATMNLRIDDQGQAVTEGAQIEIGGNERYVAMCRKHFKAAFD